MITRRDALALLVGAPAIARGLAAGQLPPSLHEQLVWYDATALVSRLRARQSTRLEVVEAYLSRIEKLNPTLNAYVTVTGERAREDARRADTIAQPDGFRPELDGVVVAHKDLFETAGVRTTAGSRLFEHHVPTRDATIVRKLAEAGAIMLGKTNTHELGGGVTTINPFFGTTLNPWDRRHIAGGSSGGSAVAVAAGLAAATTGSDTGGSVRIPAAFCGCVGFKPTFGRVSTAGLLGASPTFDHVGILARSVPDVHRIYRASVGYDPADPTTVPTPYYGVISPPSSVPTRFRVGVARNYFFDNLAPDVASAVEEAIELFRRTQSEVRDVTFPIDGKTMSRVFDPIVVAEIHERYGRDWKRRPQMFSKAFGSFLQARVPSGLGLAAAHRALLEFQQCVREKFQEVDVILTPTVPITAPRIDGPVNGGLILRNTWPFNAARAPAISIPCGFDTAGLPIGLQLVAAPFDEDTLFRAAFTLHQLSPWPPRQPML